MHHSFPFPYDDEGYFSEDFEEACCPGVQHYSYNGDEAYDFSAYDFSKVSRLLLFFNCMVDSYFILIFKYCRTLQVLLYFVGS